MGQIKRLTVLLQFGSEPIEVGELIEENHRTYFKYYASFINSGLEISPIKLKINSEINIAAATPFEGLYGVFSDSLPDGWGRLLLDRTLQSKGISPNGISVLDRLAYIGSTGMGALIYKPQLQQQQLNTFTIELDAVATATNQIIAGTATNVLDEMYKLGGSSGGARPKILVGLNHATQVIIPADNPLPNNYQHWLIKFPSSYDKPDIANIEFAYYKMAVDAGINMSTSTLLQSNLGNTYFATKRFDRIGNNRLHLHSAAGILHDNFRLSSLDYGHIMDCTFLLEKDLKAFDKILRLAAFNVFANNRDDHSKNFSFLMDDSGNWKFAPAYDLTFSYSGHGFHSTSIAGESAHPTKQHLLVLAKHFKIKNATTIIDQVQSVVTNWKKYATAANVSKESKTTINKVIQHNLL